MKGRAWGLTAQCPCSRQPYACPTEAAGSPCLGHHASHCDTKVCTAAALADTLRGGSTQPTFRTVCVFTQAADCVRSTCPASYACPHTTRAPQLQTAAPASVGRNSPWSPGARARYRALPSQQGMGKGTAPREQWLSSALPMHLWPSLRTLCWTQKAVCVAPVRNPMGLPVSRHSLSDKCWDGELGGLRRCMHTSCAGCASKSGRGPAGSRPPPTAQSCQPGPVPHRRAAQN